MKVEQFYNKNQFKIYANDGVYFQSYESTVAQVNNRGEIVFGRDWDYSKTTLRHLYLFLNSVFYNVNDFTRVNVLDNFESQKNKKTYLQKLIDKNFIKYDINL